MSESILDMKEEEILNYEDNILEGLLAASNDKTSEESYIPIEIVRQVPGTDIKKVYFKFRVRALGEDEHLECKNKATKYIKKNGIKIPDDVDITKYRSLLIYTATHDDDKQKVWGNKEAWKALNVLNAVDLINKVLLVGEKDAVVNKIEELCNYGMAEMEEIAKK